MRRLYAIAAIAALVPGCALAVIASEFTCGNAYSSIVTDVTRYGFKAAAYSPAGIAVDTSGQALDLDHLDALTTEFETCAKTAVRRCGVRVKVAPDWRQQECADGQLFPCAAFSDNCVRDACPCGCYGAIQNPGIVVITPDLRSYKHELVHLITRTPHAAGEKDLTKMPPIYACQL